MNCCVYGVPLSSVYKGWEERAGQEEEARPRGESYSHREYDSSLSYLEREREGRGRREEGKGGRPPSQFGLGLGGRPLLCFFSLLSTMAQ